MPLKSILNRAGRREKGEGGFLEGLFAAAAGEGAVAGEAEAVPPKVFLHLLLPGIDDPDALHIEEGMPGTEGEPRFHVLERAVVFAEELEDVLGGHAPTVQEVFRSGNGAGCSAAARSPHPAGSGKIFEP